MLVNLCNIEDAARRNFSVMANAIFLKKNTHFTREDWPGNQTLHTMHLALNWYHSFLHERQQRVSSSNHVCTWKAVNKGTTQGSFSGPCLFNVFVMI